MSLTPKDNNDDDDDAGWIVAVGKLGSIALWNHHLRNDRRRCRSRHEVRPIMSWKAHGGCWISDARFVPSLLVSSMMTTLRGKEEDRATTAITTTPRLRPHPPSRLLTAGNDGCVCLWDLTSSSI